VGPFGPVALQLLNVRMPDQGDTQPPAAQLSPEPQPRKQAPQCRASVSVSTQTPPQSSRPAISQVDRQRPTTQSSTAPQTMPQPPQFSASVSSWLQRPAHSVNPPSQDERHAPPLHNSSPPHRMPQPPQFSASVRVSTHSPLHSLSVPRQPLITQEPASQREPGSHDVPHAPQFIVSTLMSTQAPAQSVVPRGHPASPGTSPSSTPPSTGVLASAGGMLPSRPLSPRLRPLPQAAEANVTVKIRAICMNVECISVLVHSYVAWAGKFRGVARFVGHSAEPLDDRAQLPE